jgi:ABC-type microcin C transport system duplicated ATPase subunit YejF
MKDGAIIETEKAEKMAAHPLQEYTKKLLAAALGKQ